ncbi:GcrA family cell cycle regulator [Bradyrhizobium sp. RDM12]
MSWVEKDVTLLKELWALGHSATQIARALGCSRNAVCGRLTRLRLKRSEGRRCRPPVPARWKRMYRNR